MGKYGHPGSSGTAQSGGKNSTFGGGKGGTKQTRGVTSVRRIGTTVQVGSTIAVRSEGGNKKMVGKTGSIGKPPPLRAGRKQTTVKPTVRKPVRGADL